LQEAKKHVWRNVPSLINGQHLVVASERFTKVAEMVCARLWLGRIDRVAQRLKAYPDGYKRVEDELVKTGPSPPFDRPDREHRNAERSHHNRSVCEDAPPSRVRLGNGGA
jgi:hypothetical protein